MSLDPERIAVVIGKHGQTKKLIEEKTGTKIRIDSKNYTYSVEADPTVDPSRFKDELKEPSVREYLTTYIIEAINMGFNPIIALKLLSQDYSLEIIDLEKTIGRSEKRLRRIKGRIIGDSGKIKEAIEKFANVHLSIYKKYLAMIGDFDSLKIARKAINMIIQGAPHKAVLDYLQKEHEKRKMEEFRKEWKPII